jgi:hypothetical protein
VRHHGEAGSVDLAAVEAEQIRLRELLAPYPKANRLNLDETSFFMFFIPERGLASKKMSGKKKNKFRISLCFICNATGTEQFPVYFIGKYKQPRCFGKVSPQKQGFQYWNNKKAWMTSEIFEQ